MTPLTSSVLQPVLEHAGVTVSAISGVLAARGKRIDLFGVLVLALVTAFGGGTVRDVLAGDLPPVWLRTPDFLANGTLSALAAFFFVRRRVLPQRVLLIVDAFVLALFTLIGTRKGVSLHFTLPVAVLLGVCTGVAGGILRDVLVGELPLVFRPEIRLYATASICGGVVFVLLHQFRVPTPLPTLTGLGTVLGMRLAAIRWALSLPVMEHESGTSFRQPLPGSVASVSDDSRHTPVSK